LPPGESPALEFGLFSRGMLHSAGQASGARPRRATARPSAGDVLPPSGPSREMEPQLLGHGWTRTRGSVGFIRVHPCPSVARFDFAKPSSRRPYADRKLIRIMECPRSDAARRAPPMRPVPSLLKAEHRGPPTEAVKPIAQRSRSPNRSSPIFWYHSTL